MFETIQDLNKTLPRPKMTGDPERDLLIREQYINNGKIMRSEAFACMGRSLAKMLKKIWHRLPVPGHVPHSHRA